MSNKSDVKVALVDMINLASNEVRKFKETSNESEHVTIRPAELVKLLDRIRDLSVQLDAEDDSDEELNSIVTEMHRAGKLTMDDLRELAGLVPPQQPTTSAGKRARKLTAADAVEIRKRAAHGEARRDLATAYGVSLVFIWHIINFKRWADAGGPDGRGSPLRRKEKSGDS